MSQVLQIIKKIEYNAVHYSKGVYMLELLRSKFGFNEFRAGQREAIETYWKAGVCFVFNPPDMVSLCCINCRLVCYRE